MRHVVFCAAVAVLACNNAGREEAPSGAMRYVVDDTPSELSIIALDRDGNLAGSVVLKVVEPGYPHAPEQVADWGPVFGLRGRVITIEAQGVVINHETEGMAAVTLPLPSIDRIGEPAAVIKGILTAPEVSLPLFAHGVTYYERAADDGSIEVTDPPSGDEAAYLSCSFSAGCAIENGQCCEDPTYYSGTTFQARCCTDNTFNERACNTGCGGTTPGQSCSGDSSEYGSYCVRCSGGNNLCCRNTAYGLQGNGGCVTFQTTNTSGPNHYCLAQNNGGDNCWWPHCTPSGWQCSDGSTCCSGSCDTDWSFTCN